MKRIVWFFSFLIAAALMMPQTGSAGCRPHPGARAHYYRHATPQIFEEHYYRRDQYVEQYAPPPAPFYGESLLPCDEASEQGVHGFATQQLYTPQPTYYAPPYASGSITAPSQSGDMCFTYEYTMHESVLHVRPLRAPFQPGLSVPDQILQNGVQKLSFPIQAQPRGQICLNRQLMARYSIVDVLICERTRDKGWLGPGNFRRGMSGMPITQIVPVGDRRLIAGSRY